MVLLFSVIVLSNCPISNIPWSQDFTGVPAVVDLACMRDAMNKLGSDSNKINPLVYFYFLNTFILSVCGERWICGVWTSWFNSLLWPMVSHIMLIAKTWEIWWDVSCWYLIIMKNCNIWTLLLFYSWLWSSFMIFFLMLKGITCCSYDILFSSYQFFCCNLHRSCKFLLMSLNIQNYDVYVSFDKFLTGMTIRYVGSCRPCDWSFSSSWCS